MNEKYDVAVVGSGIIGLATALRLTDFSRLKVVIIEAENRIAGHQSTHNSGVIHSGIYYKPGSTKARTCIEGRRLLIEFCETHRIPFEQCGKLIIATNDREIPVLDAIEERGRGNGLRGLRRLSSPEIKEYEPNAHGVAALWVPETGIVNFGLVCKKIAEIAQFRGCHIETSCPVTGVARAHNEIRLMTGKGPVFCKLMVNCAGLYSDRVARRCGVNPKVAIFPFRGEYYRLRPERTGLVRNLIYPVPDPHLPFLGVHFTRKLDGTVEAGPNAVLALSRVGYRKTDISIRDSVEMILFPGFWRLARRYWRSGLGEMWRSWSKSAFTRALRRLVPAIDEADLTAGASGVRAQAVTRDGWLADDFIFQAGERSIHILNAPSPAATASLSIGRTIASLVVETLSGL
ncbi:MAG: L-2-hydroxyglutarate oxidase [bacterium JZ-2024 1]